MGRIVNLLTANGLHLAQESKRQVLALDSEFEDMEAQITALQAENLKLQAQVNPLERKVQQLTDQIQRMQSDASAASDDSLDEKAEKLLLAIANKDRLTEEGVRALLGGGTRAQADYYISLLRTRGLIRLPMAYGTESRYRATDEGLAYLHKIGRL